MIKGSSPRQPKKGQIIKRIHDGKNITPQFIVDKILPDIPTGDSFIATNIIWIKHINITVTAQSVSIGEGFKFDR